MSVLCFSEYKSSFCLQAQNLLFKRTKFDCGKFIVLLLKTPAMAMQSSTAIGCAVIMTVVLLVHAAPIVDEQEEYLPLWADLEQARADQYRPSEPPRGEQEEYLPLWTNLANQEQARADQYRPNEPPRGEQEEYLPLWANLEQARADQYQPNEPPRGVPFQEQAWADQYRPNEPPRGEPLQEQDWADQYMELHPAVNH